MCLLTAVLGGGFKENICDAIASFTWKNWERARETSTIFYATTEYNPEKLYSQVFRFQEADICKNLTRLY